MVQKKRLVVYVDPIYKERKKKKFRHQDSLCYTFRTLKFFSMRYFPLGQNHCEGHGACLIFSSYRSNVLEVPVMLSIFASVLQGIWYFKDIVWALIIHCVSLFVSVHDLVNERSNINYGTVG